MTDRAAPITLAGAPLGDTRHVCALFGSAEEEYRALLPFMKDGIDCGDKAIHVISPERLGEHVQRLDAVGIDRKAAEARGQLEVRSSADLYLQQGRFDQDRMIEVFEDIAGGDEARGFARSRIVCSMDWAAGAPNAIGDLIEFEARINDVWQRHDDIVICSYRVARFGGDAVIDIMRTHPMVIIGGTLQRNPFFVPPGQFLAEFRARRSSERRT